MTGEMGQRRAAQGGTLAAAAFALAVLAACGGDSPGAGDAPTQSSEPGTRVVAVRYVAKAEALDRQPGVEITVTSERPFPVRNEIVALQIGAGEFLLSRYPPEGDTHSLIFTLTAAEWAATREGDPVDVHYGKGAPPQWSFGPLHKGTLQTPTPG
jgi:hypothetical protein